MQQEKNTTRKSVGDAKIYDYDPDLSKHPIPPHLHAVPESANHRLDSYLMRFERMLNWLFRTMMLLAGLGLAFLMFSQVIMRYIFESPFTGIEELSILLAVWIYFLGMGYATREREHIHGGIVSLVVKDPFKVNIIRFFGSITCMIAAIIFGYFACKYALKEIDRGRVSINLRWPRGFWSASMIVGFAMMVGYFLLETINEFRDLRRSWRQRRTSREELQHEGEEQAKHLKEEVQ
ncbi:TRAP transporter small permease [Neptuniibacter caesariensis]|uniref:TRAP transporter small permease protein n=1 Tax=Neptuniibacter caesariensis TaxID=207954 RepID=A0A7U8C642_NEPCE|nr:TRAP transporter small permease [Neptuniibacter caesariensis]EAR62213.1 probable DctQ (C4-dicarboxylate permease, small subunit) [Oceanospirillum sp. MED92] [Neptuniibacter caesariensis]